MLKTKQKDIEWLLHKLFIITFFTSILYSIQVLTGLPFLPYDLGEPTIDKYTGLLRYYNSPPLLALFIYSSIFAPTLIKSRFVKYAPMVLLLAQFLTLGRIEIATTLFIILLGLLIKKQGSKLIKVTLVLSISLLPIMDILISRADSGGETGNDIEEILSGQFKSRALTGDMSGGTMSYRLAWIYERMLYLKNRPLAENIFGLGMISDSQERVVNRMYKFRLGIIDQETGHQTQLVTPDIAYGNFITQFGYFGGSILLFIWIRILIIAFRRRQKNLWMFCLFLLLTGYMIRSLSGSTISTTANLVIPFLILSLNKDLIVNKLGKESIR